MSEKSIKTFEEFVASIKKLMCVQPKSSLSAMEMKYIHEMYDADREFSLKLYEYEDSVKNNTFKRKEDELRLLIDVLVSSRINPETYGLNEVTWENLFNEVNSTNIKNIILKKITDL